MTLTFTTLTTLTLTLMFIDQYFYSFLLKKFVNYF